MEITVDVAPAHPVRGSQIDVIIRTYAPVAESIDMFPQGSPYPFPAGLIGYLWAGPPYPFDVTVLSPSGRRIDVPVEQTSDDASAYRGSVMVGESGRWTLMIANYPGREWPIDVVEGPIASASGCWVAVAGVLAIGIALTAVLALRLVRDRRRPDDRWVGPTAR